jgi:hypothetical protein
MDEVIEWIGEGGYDPQGRIKVLAEAHGHTLGPWEYGERHGPWQHEQRACTACGALAVMGHRTGRPGWGQSTALAIWGSALTAACTAGQAEAGQG